MAADVTLLFGVNVQPSYSLIDSQIRRIATALETSGRTQLRFSINPSSLAQMESQLSKLASMVNTGFTTGGSTSTDNTSTTGTSTTNVEASGLTDAVNKQKEFNKAQKETIDNNNAINRSTKESLNMDTSRVKMWSGLNNQMARNATFLQSQPELMARYQATMNKLSNPIGSANGFSTLTEARNAVAHLGEATSKAGMQVGTFHSRLVGLFKQRFEFTLMSMAVMMVIQAFRQMLQNVKEIDSAMVELKKVTDETDKSYSAFLDRAAEKSQKLGTSMKDYITATATYGRLGYNFEDAERLADLSTIYSNIGVDIDINNANEYLVSTLHGFGLVADQAESVVDKFNEVGNKYAIGSAGIGEALKRSSASLSVANNSLDESIALVTAMNTVLQNPEKVGTTLKTVTMFLRASKTEAEQAGESIEGMANSTSELRDQILTLTGNKVDIMADANTYKNTYQVLKEISTIWDGITDIDKANILELLGGKRNANAVAAVLENFEIAENALKTSQDSAGSAARANEIYLDSVQGKAATLGATFEELSNNLIGSEISKDFLEVITAILQIINDVLKLINVLGGLKTVLTSIIGIMLVIKAEAIFAWFAKLRTSLITTSQAAMTTGKSVRFLGIQLSAAQKHMLVIIAVIAAIKLLVEGIKTQSFEHQLEKLQEQADKLQGTIENIKDVNNELDTTSDRIRELSLKDNLTFVETEELAKLKQVNTELEAELINLEALENRQSKQTESAFVKAINSHFNKDKDYNEFMGELEKDPNPLFNPFASTWQKILSVIPAFGSFGNSSINWKYNNEDYLNHYYDLLDEAFKTLENISWNSLSESTQNSYIQAKEEQWAIAKKLSDDFGGLENVYQMIYNDKMFANIREALDKLMAEEELTVEETIENFNKLYKNNQELQYLIQQLGIDTSQEGWQTSFFNWLEVLNPKVEDTISEFETLKEELESLKEELESLRKAYESVQSVIKDYNDNGYISIENFEKLLEVDTEYLNLLIDENGQLNLNTEAYKDLMKAKLGEMIITRARSMFNDVLNMTLEEAQAYANAEAYDTETNSLMGLIQAEYALYAIKAKAKDRETGTTAYTGALQRALYSVANLMSLYESTTDTANETTENFTDSLKKQKEALEDQKQELEDAKSNIQDLIDLVVDMIKKEKEVEKEAYEQQKENLDKLIEKQKELLETKKEEAKFTEELAKKQNTVAQNALAASIATLDDSSAGKKSSKIANDALIESQGELKTYLSDHEYDTRIEALDKTQKANEEYYDKLIKTVDDYLDDERKMYEDACEMIDNDNGTLYNKLYQYVYKYTTTSEAEFNNLWTKAQKALETYDNAHTPLFETMDILHGSVFLLDESIDKIENRIDSVSGMVQKQISGASTAMERFKELLSELENLDYEYYFKYNGETFKSTQEDRELAAWEIQGLLSDRGYNLPTGAIVGGLKAYASGTTSATGGLSMVGEDGAELRVLNRGDGIIPAKTTANLMAIGSNPNGWFIKVVNNLLDKIFNTDIIGNIFKTDIPIPAFAGGNTAMPNISISMPINIEGNADKETVKLLSNKSNEIIDRAVEKVMKIALQYSNVPKRY